MPTYGFMAALGMISGLSVIFHLARFRGLDPDQMWNLGGIAAFSGILGAKLLMILVDWREYLAEPGRIFSLETLAIGRSFFRRVAAGDRLQLVVCAAARRFHFSRQPTCLRQELRWATSLDALAALRRDAAMAAKPTCHGRLRFTIRGRLSSPARR